MADKEQDSGWDVEHVSSRNGSGSQQPEEHVEAAVKLDPRGLPLSPQPSDDPMDPLNWKPWLKIMVLAEVSVLSFLALLSASLIVRGTIYSL